MDTGCEEKSEGLRRPDREINTPGLLSPINSSLLGILIIDHNGTIRLLKDAEFIGGWRQDVALVRLLEPAVKDSLERMNRVVDETVYALASAIEKRDPYTAGHQQRVARLACAIAAEMGGFDDDRMKGVRTAAVLHDIGKLYVPSELLSKPGRLTDVEFELLKTHPQAGYQMLQHIEFPWPVARTVQQHHERLDGSGYPMGLAGDELLLEARVVGVADVVEAMSSHRPYRPGRGIEPALLEIRSHRGSAYDCGVVDACLALFRNGYQLGIEGPLVGDPFGNGGWYAVGE